MWFPARLIHVRPLRRAVQAVRVALAVDRPTAFAVALVRGGEAAFTARRTGQRVHLRPRHDLQVAREHVSKDALRPPPEVAARLAARGPVRVADIGANIGLFTLAALHAYGPG